MDSKLKINYEIMINLSKIKLLSVRHISTFQIRVTVHQQSNIDKKKLIPATPYLILSPEDKQRQKKSQSNNSSSIRRSSTFHPITSQIDNQTNSFITKTFMNRSIDTYQDMNEIVVFKGAFQLSIDQFINQQSGKKLKEIFNKLFVCCEVFQVNNFSSELFDSWVGFTLIDQGNVFLPINFYDLSLTLNAEMIFFWSSIQLVNQDQKLDTLKIQKINEKLSQLFKYQKQKIFQTPKQFNNEAIKNSQYKKIDSKQLMTVLNNFNQQSYQLWKKFQQNFAQKFKLIPLQICEIKKNNFLSLLNQYHWKNHILITDHKQQTSLKNKDSFYEQLIFYPFDEHTRNIVISHQDWKKLNNVQQNDNQQNKKLQLIIFVHGYQASSFDMQTLSAYFKSKNPSSIITFVSSSNEGKTQQKIQQLGHRLAVQIKNYINNKLEVDLEQLQISFICHSMGGLIARSALKYLQLYKKNFKTFVSLSSPHLGYLYHHSTLIKTSLWVLNQFKKDPSMIQLTMQDNLELQKTYLYQLSKRKELEWFQYPVFIGSRQDQYVPFWSALVQDKDFFFQTKQAKIYKSLFKNLSQKIQNKIIRVEIVYQDKIRDLSTFVGRTAHIRILNCIQVMQMLYLLLQRAF